MEEEGGRDAARLHPKLAFRNRDRDGGVTVAPSGDREAQTQCGHNSAIRLLFPSLSARKKTIIVSKSKKLPLWCFNTSPFGKSKVTVARRRRNAERGAWVPAPGRRCCQTISDFFWSR